MASQSREHILQTLSRKYLISNYYFVIVWEHAILSIGYPNAKVTLISIFLIIEIIYSLSIYYNYNYI